jgi:tripartite-type tricarboxylate transporter receptor subunit TctC
MVIGYQSKHWLLTGVRAVPLRYADVAASPTVKESLMPIPRRGFFRLAASGLAACSLSRTARAQAWPSRPVRWLVPFTAGGSTDLLARIIAQWLSDRLGQSVVVENRPGGGTNIATQAVVNAPPDGYTLLFTVTTHTINPSLYKALPFDFKRDIVPVAGIAELPLVLSAHPSLPAETVPEFIAYCKANPGKVTVASFGARTVSHLVIELLKSSTGIEVLHVPYPGGSAMMTDLLPGRIQAGVDALPNQLPHIKSGAVRALAVMSTARVTNIPDVPTMSEVIPAFNVGGWTGIGAPRGTPEPIIERLNREVNAALDDGTVKARFAEVGAVPFKLSPAEARDRIASDIEKWARVVRGAGIQPE